MTIREGILRRAEQAFDYTKLAVGIGTMAMAVAPVDARNRVGEIADRVGKILGEAEPTLSTAQTAVFKPRAAKSEQLQGLAEGYIPNEIVVGQSWIDAATVDEVRYKKALANRRTPKGVSEQELDALRTTANQAQLLRDHGVLVSGKAICKGFSSISMDGTPCETTADNLHQFKQQLLRVHPELPSLSVEQAHKLFEKMGCSDDMIAIFDRFGVTPLPHPEEVI